jgi:hypothetical protein
MGNQPRRNPPRFCNPKLSRKEFSVEKRWRHARGFSSTGFGFQNQARV